MSAEMLWPSPPRLRSLQFFSVLCLAFAAAPAEAESALELPYPSPNSFGEFPASTYDENGLRVGSGLIAITRLENGHVALRVRSGFDGGAWTELDAELEPIGQAANPKLRVLHERSQSYDAEGTQLVTLFIDHVKGEASCTPPESDGGKASLLTLPSPDRVVNVPLNLLFETLRTGEVEIVQTQVFFCLGGARMLGFAGKLSDERTAPDARGRRIREVRYGPDGKSFISWAAKAMAPKISFWMDVNHGGAYVAHRMPLYSGGPVVYVILDTIDPSAVIAR